MDTQHPQSNTLGKASLIAGVSLLLGLLFNYFFYEMEGFGIAFPLFVALVIVGLFSIARFFQKQINNEVRWLLIPLIFFSTMVAVRSSDFLTFLNVVASVLLLLAINNVAFGGKLKNFWIGTYIKIVFLPLKFVLPIFQTFSDIFFLRGIQKDKKTVVQVVKGIVLTIPVLVIFLALFSSADLMFQKYISDIIHIEPETVSRSILVLIITLIFTGAYTYCFQEKEGSLVKSQRSNNHTIGHIESSIVLSSVNMLFFIFILVQATYLFGGEGTIATQDFTYAEYARRGFFELITVAIVSFLLLLATEKFIVKKEIDHALVFKVLSTILVIQIMLIMASALTRLSLYEEAYGFTTSRLFGHAFIFLLVAVFSLLLYKIYKDKQEHAFAFRVFISMALFLAVMNIINPDEFIARRNIERFTATGKLDAEYLGRLSDDALPTTIKILDIPNDDLKTGFARELSQRRERGRLSYFSTWQSWNMSRARADRILNSNIHKIEPYKDYQQQNPDSIELYK